jgi:YD repeat-containing protein
VRNVFGEVIQETSPDRGKSVYYYDQAGDMTASIDGRGSSTIRTAG